MIQKIVIVILSVLLFMVYPTKNTMAQNISSLFFTIDEPLNINAHFFQKGKLKNFVVKSNFNNSDEKNIHESFKIDSIAMMQSNMMASLELYENGNLKSVYIEDGVGREIRINFNEKGLYNYFISDNNHFINNSLFINDSIDTRMQIGDIFTHYIVNQDGTIHYVE